MALTDEELEISLILAQACNLTYLQNFDFQDIKTQTGIDNTRIFNFRDGGRWDISVLLGTYKNYTIISFKGTDCLNDWIINANVWKTNNGSEGRVHNGFGQAVNINLEDLSKKIEDYLKQYNDELNNEILLTGHSLGGVLAILTASSLISLPQFSRKIKRIYTYGAPRVGDQNFKQNYNEILKHYRFEYGNDPVPSSPSLGYVHTGERYYLPKDEPTIKIGSQGTEAYKVHIRALEVIFKVFVANSGSHLRIGSIEHLSNLFKDVRDHINDHNIEKYIQHIQNYKQFLPIIKGLENGSLKRHGSVIKETETGNIVCYLLESQRETDRLPISSSQKVSLVINSVKQIALQMSQTTPLASALTLCGSLYVFAQMNRKLNELQTDLYDIQTLVEDKINIISQNINRIYDLLAVNRQEQQNIMEAVDELHQAFLIQNISKLQAAIKTRNSFPDTPVHNTFQVASEVGIFLSQQARQREVGIDKRMLITDIAIKGWVMATATQGYLLLEIGNIDEARTLLNQEVQALKDIVVKWADSLLSNEGVDDISTAYRFTYSIFTERGIEREQVDRIAYISTKDEYGKLCQDKIEEKILNMNAEFTMSTASRTFTDENWIKTQKAVAEYLDTWSELLARLESLQYFANLCKNKGVKNSLELLPGNDTEPGLYLQFPNTVIL